MKVDPCSLCGGTEMKLIDGYYYCVECGTQDMNVRQTAVEHNVLADGTFSTAVKKKITFVPEKTTEMSVEWYKWHAYNFILAGLADELIALGASPSFKTKLLWIWTKYIKKYQKKEQFGLIPSLDGQDSESHQSASEMGEKGKPKKKKKKYDPDNPNTDITEVTKMLFISMLYVALNLDKSDIQLTHLLRFLKEGRITYPNFKKFIPEGIKMKAVPNVLFRRTIRTCCPVNVRATAMTLFKKLDLGTPVVPDLRKIIDLYMKELCLPKDLKPLILSLMHLQSCGFLEVDTSHDYVIRVPDYEAVLMAYVLFALKMCFGLDGEYEVKLSDAVEKINERENYPKSYKRGMSSDPTERLFSFREWCNYIHFRKRIISQHCLFIAEQHSLGMDDDYVYMEQMEKRQNAKIKLKDEITIDILNKIHRDDELSVIPNAEFMPTFTPLADYTQVVAEHCKDPELKLLLSEDFTQYSLKYACENFVLIDPETSKNLIVGVSETNKTMGEDIMGTLVTVISDLSMVYIRNCENKHWLKTNPPTLEHIQIVEKDGNEKDKDHGYVSNTENISEKETLSSSDMEPVKETATSPNELNNLSDMNLNKEIDSSESDKSIIYVESHKGNAINEDEKDAYIKYKSKIFVASDDEKELEIIREDEGKNIFDDEFDNVDIKEEVDKQEEYDNDIEMLKDYNEPTFEQHYENGQHSDDEDGSGVSSVDSFEFNPDKFDRKKAIKELILAACQKYKIQIPAEFNTKEPKKRKAEFHNEAGASTEKRRRTKRGEIRVEVDKILASYYDHVESDVINQVSQKVKSAIQNMSQTQEQLEEHGHFEEPLSINIEGTTSDDQSNINIDKTEIEHNEGPKLFDEDSDGENNIEDFIPRGDPKFDENKYDVNQLYVRIEDDDHEEFDAGPELKEIVDRKIEEHKKDRSFLKLKRVVQTNYKSDSDDDVLLSVIQEEKLINDQLDKIMEDRLEPLIQKDIPELKYWLRHYVWSYIVRSLKNRNKFDLELRENAPVSFYFVINECASVLNSSSFDLYKTLMNFERDLTDSVIRKDSKEHCDIKEFNPTDENEGKEMMFDDNEDIEMMLDDNEIMFDDD